MTDKVDRIRINLTLTRVQVEALDSLVDRGLYMEQTAAIRAAIRLFLRDWRVPPFHPEAIPVEPILKPLGEPIVEPVEPAVKAEPEEVPEKEEGQEHVEPCPEGLDWPLQDLTICRGKGCKHYKRKYKDKPAACNWTEWKKIGWENEVEDEEVVMILCESGAHKPGLIPHIKKDVTHGWATYICTKCHKETPMLISKAEGETQNE